MTTPAPFAPGRLRRAAAESLGGLPQQFWWLWLSTLVNRLGGFVVTFLALYLTAQRGYSATYAGLVASLYGLGSVIAALGGGVLTDRIGRRPTMLAAQLLTAASTAALGFADGQLMIAAVAFLVGLSGNASRPAISAVIADVVPAEDRVRAYALNYWAINIGFGVSATVAGLVAAHGYLTLFLADAASTLLCALVVFVKVPETRPAAAPRESAQPQVTLGTVFRDRRFMAVVGLTFLFAMVMQQGSTTLAVQIGEAGLSTTQFGLVAAVNGLLIVLLQIPLTRLTRHHDRGTLLLVGGLLVGWGFGLTAFAGSSAVVYGLTVAVWTVGEILQTPTTTGLVAEMSPTHARGRYQGTYSLAWSSAACLGPAVGGFLLQHAGGGVVWGGCAVIGTIAGVGFMLLGRRTRAAAAVPAATAAAAAAARVDSRVDA
ncbi:MFS family permease [Kitasatospora sp. MAA4]|uniref:MDR family MFS transporter n=1 Tax=Kitasatospora sp. MAA4 TaxID=3035093 RepID=UPI00247552E0|nr:MFS transporter [Kitasatospora sp. MAA4]MDH6135371.1 MFS family permease [Kitasatospora sp. MAA4]